MRTTVTLDPDTECLIREAVAARGQSFKRVLHEAIRAGLGGTRPVSQSAPPAIPGFRSGYAAGIDRSRLQQLSDEMETEGFPSRGRA
jgi:hypothetical protein